MLYDSHEMPRKGAYKASTQALIQSWKKIAKKEKRYIVFSNSD
jgi:hypothetical protein